MWIVAITGAALNTILGRGNMYGTIEIWLRKHYPYIIVGVLLLAAGYLLGSRADVPNDDGRTAAVGARIDSAAEVIDGSGREQRKITAGIEQAEIRAARAAEHIKATGDAIRDCRASVDRCQQLLAAIRSRGKSKAGAN